MTSADLFALSPWLVLAATPVAVLLSIALERNHGAAALIALFGLAGSAVCLALVVRAGATGAGELLIVDGYAAWFAALVLASAATTVLVAFGYFAIKRGEREQPEELYALIAVGALGGLTVAASAHLVSFFLGIELLSVPLYALIAYRKDACAIEAGFKYLVLGGAASAMLLFGIALVYADLGTMSFRDLALLSVWRGADAGMVAPGAALIAVGIGFKLALAPFHAWSPDVYEGANAPAAAFIATVSKGAVIAAAARLLVPLVLAGSRVLPMALALLASASILAGNLLALQQQSVRRLLAYSSVAHLGTMLIALVGAGARAVIALGYYAAAYLAATLIAFAALAALAGDGQAADADSLDDLAGLAWRRPLVAAALGLAMLSLAGIPFTAGFMAKIAIVAAGLDAARVALVLVLAAGSAIGLYYYLRVIAALVAEPLLSPPGPSGRRAPGRVAVTPPTLAFSMTALAIAIVWLGVHPFSVERILVAALSLR